MESIKTDQTIFAILSHSTLAEAARSLGVNEATLWRRMQEPEVQRMLRETKRRVYGQALIRLQTSATEAVDVLSEIMRNKEHPPSTRANAARAVLELASKAAQVDDLEKRIEGLENILDH